MEGISAFYVRQALNEIQPNELLERHGAAGPPLTGFYRLETTRLISLATTG